jgi:hypothetical protein
MAVAMGIATLPPGSPTQLGAAFNRASCFRSSSATVSRSAFVGLTCSRSAFSARTIAATIALIAIMANEPTTTIVAMTPVLVLSLSVAMP